jgi:phage tail sheath gpL-like
MRRPYACYYISTPIATTIGASGTFVKLAGITTLHASRSFTMPQNNRAVYTGSPTADVKITVTGAIRTTGIDADQVGLRIARDGTSVEESEIHFHEPGTGATEHPFAMTWVEEAMATNDYLEVWVTNLSDTDSVISSSMVVLVEGLFT